MNEKNQRIRFQGKEWLLVVDAITTDERYANFLCSYAHIYPSGEIRRYGEVIGHADDIEVLGDVDDIEHGTGTVISGLTDSSWYGNPQTRS